jgi:hypothetical protein
VSRRAVHKLYGVPQSRYIAIWRAISLFTSAATLDMFGLSQQWRITVSKLALGDIGTYAVAIYGVLICAPLLILECFLLWAYARKIDPTQIWSCRIPDIWNLGAEPHGSGAKIGQSFALFATLGVAGLGQVHFIDKVLAGTVYVNGVKFSVGISEHLGHYMALGDALALGSDFKARFQDWAGGVTYYPFWESWMLLMLTVTSLLGCAVCLYEVARQRRDGQVLSTPDRQNRATKKLPGDRHKR